MKLDALLGPHMTVPPDGGNVTITGLTADSRKVEPGFLFAALSGTRTDGARFVAQAVEKGAVAVLGAPAIAAQIPAGVAFLACDEPRRALALVAAQFYGAQPEVAVAVTGTSGKTSVADFTRQIFTACGHAAASLGTIGLVKADGSVYGSLTTPDPVTLHKDLAALAGEGVTHLAFEASSHGLDQHRLDGVRLRAGAFTNLGRDHLDYHPTMQAYLEAKLRLFRDLLPPGAPAVINSDDVVSAQVVAAVTEAGRKVLSVGTAGAFLSLVEARRSGFAQHLAISHAGKTYYVELPLIGAYQASNALVAAGLAIAAGDAPDVVLPALRHLKGVKGRLEIVGRARGGLVVVDYAHKPEALTAALSAAREFASGRLICVFGCGGDRDKGKRPIMGAIASKCADITIVTDDNPRSEDPSTIRAEILAAAPGAREIGDRAEAIRTAIALLRSGDVLVIAGKGHETGQIVGATVLPFSDHEAVAAALAEGPDA